jgi:hypothetical protein
MHRYAAAMALSYDAAKLGLVLRPSGTVRAALAVGLLGGAYLLLVHAFAGIDVHATARAIARIGPLAPLVLLPFVGGMLFDAAGQKLLLRALDREVGLASLFAIRTATEAIHLTAPAGFLVADTVTVTLLRDRLDIPLCRGAVVAIARKWLVMRAHGLYVVLGALVGASALAGVSSRRLGQHGLPALLCVTALVPLGLSVGLGAGFRTGSLLSGLCRKLGRVPWPGATQGSPPPVWGAAMDAADAGMARLGAAASITWAASASFLGTWLFESLETALILGLVGARFDLPFALGAEVGISMLRSIGNVAPAGLGIQDAGYATLLPAMGTPVELVAAFVVVKRAREIAWIGAGYLLLAALRRPPSKLMDALVRWADRSRIPRLERSVSTSPPRPASSEAV